MPESKMSPISSEDALLMFKKWHDEKLPVAAMGSLLFGSSREALGFAILCGEVISVNASMIRICSGEGAYLGIPLTGVRFSYVESAAILPESFSEGGAMCDSCIRLESDALANCFLVELSE
jgi:hypothetical protein